MLNTYLGEGEFLMGNKLDSGLVDVAGTVVVLGIYFFERSVL